MLTAAVVGDVFASPPTEAVLAAIRTVTSSAGALLIVKNYTGLFARLPGRSRDTLLPCHPMGFWQQDASASCIRYLHDPIKMILAQFSEEYADVLTADVRTGQLSGCRAWQTQALKAQA